MYHKRERKICGVSENSTQIGWLPSSPFCPIQMVLDLFQTTEADWDPKTQDQLSNYLSQTKCDEAAQHIWGS